MSDSEDRSSYDEDEEQRSSYDEDVEEEYSHSNYKGKDTDKAKTFGNNVRVRVTVASFLGDC